MSKSDNEFDLISAAISAEDNQEAIFQSICSELTRNPNRAHMFIKAFRKKLAPPFSAIESTVYLLEYTVKHGNKEWRENVADYVFLKEFAQLALHPVKKNNFSTTKN